MKHSSWHDLIKRELPNHYYNKINTFMDAVYESGIVYPPRDKVFNAIQITPLENVKVVIITKILTMDLNKLKDSHFLFQTIYQLLLHFKIF